jgi:MFS family permease
MVYSAFLLAYMVCMTPGGWLADRFGPWLALVLMGFGSGLFGVCTGLIGLGVFSAGLMLFFLLVVRTLMGVFTAPIYPASARIIAHWFPHPQRAAANGLVMAAALVGISATFFGFGTLLDLFDWPVAFLITGSITAMLALAWTCYATNYPRHHRGVNQAEQQWIGSDRPEREEHARPSGASWEALIRNRSLILLTLSYAAIGYFEYLFYFWMHHYFEEELKLSKSDSRLYATIVNLSMAGGMALGGWLSDRLQRSYGYRVGRTAVPVVGMLTGAAFLVLGAMASEPVWIVILFALALAAVGATEGPFWATAIDLGGKQAATSAGIFNTGGNAGGALAPLLTPVIGEVLGWTWAIVFGSIVCLSGVSLWWWIDPRNGRVAEGAGPHPVSGHTMEPGLDHAIKQDLRQAFRADEPRL